MAAGCPRTVSPPPEELIKLGKEMIDWIKLHKPAHIKAWWSVEKEFTEPYWETLRKRNEFIQYYARALDIISLEYIDKESKIPDKIKDRFLRLYFKDLRDQDYQDKEFEAKLGQQKDGPAPNQINVDIQQENMRLRALLEKHGHQC